MSALGTFCEFKYGKSLPDKVRRGGEFPVYGSNGIVGYHDTPLTAGASIIVGRKGSAGALQYSPMPCCPIDTTYYIDRTCTDVDLRWLYFTLQNLGLDNLSKHVAVPGLNRNDAYEKELLVPPLDEQKRIAAVLDKADSLRRQRGESLELTKKLLQSVFIDMFGDPATNPRILSIRKLGDFYSSPKEGAKCGPFGSALKKSDGQQTGVPVWGIDNISTDGRFIDTAFTRISSEKFEDLRSYEAKNGDILISRAGTVGKMCVVSTTEKNGIIGSNLIRLRLNADLLSPHWFIAFMKYAQGRVARLRAGAEGAFTHMSTKILQGLEFPYPIPDLQKDYLKACRAVENVNEPANGSAHHFDRLFSSIQQRAFRGDLDLSRLRLDVDEPVSVPPITEVRTVDGRTYRRPGSFIASPEIEMEMFALEEKFDQAPAEPRPWSENYFKYRTLSQALIPPFSFAQIWEATLLDMEEASYETVKDKVFEYVRDGILRQHFCRKRKEIVFVPNRK